MISAKYHLNSTSQGTSKNGGSHNEEETMEQILKQETTAAAMLCQLKTHHSVLLSNLPVTKDVLGVVATLAGVENDNLNRSVLQFADWITTGLNHFNELITSCKPSLFLRWCPFVTLKQASVGVLGTGDHAGARLQNIWGCQGFGEIWLGRGNNQQCGSPWPWMFHGKKN